MTLSLCQEQILPGPISSSCAYSLCLCHPHSSPDLPPSPLWFDHHQRHGLLCWSGAWVQLSRGLRAKDAWNIERAIRTEWRRNHFARRKGGPACQLWACPPAIVNAKVLPHRHSARHEEKRCTQTTPAACSPAQGAPPVLLLLRGLVQHGEARTGARPHYQRGSAVWLERQSLGDAAGHM